MADGTFVANETGRKWKRVEAVIREVLAQFEQADRNAAYDAFYDMVCDETQTDAPAFAKRLRERLEEAGISDEAMEVLFKPSRYREIVARVAVLREEYPSIKAAKAALGEVSVSEAESAWVAQLEQRLAEQAEALSQEGVIDL